MTPSTDPTEPRLLELLELAQAMVRDLDGRITHWTRGAEHLYGWTRQEAMGRIAHEMLATEFPEPLDQIQAQLLRDSQWHGELRHRTQDGRIIRVASHWALRRTADGQPDAVAEVNNDITAQGRAEDALLRLAAIVASSNDAIIGMTLEGVITDWNDAAQPPCSATRSPRSSAGRSPLLYPPERRGEETILLERLRRGEPVSHFDTTRRHRDGTIIPVSVNLSPILDASGAVIGASKIVRDLSDTLERERRLTEIQAELTHVSRLSELGQLVSALVHEVNQPLTAIGNYTQAIQRLLAAGNAERVPLALEKIIEQTDRAYQIIQRLRDFVRKGELQRRAERRRTPSRRRSPWRRSARRHAVPRSTPTLRPGPITWRSTASRSNRCCSTCCATRWRRCRASHGRRSWCAPNRLASRMVEVGVADSGPGLPDMVRQKLFQPFVTTKPSGMGVGLSVCRAIIEAHGGQMAAENNVGGGTVFRFTVPVRVWAGDRWAEDSVAADEDLLI